MSYNKIKRTVDTEDTMITCDHCNQSFILTAVITVKEEDEEKSFTEFIPQAIKLFCPYCREYIND